MATIRRPPPRPYPGAVLASLATAALLLTAPAAYADGARPDLSFCTIFGGDSTDRPDDLAVDPRGNVYVVGLTSSRQLPGSAVRHPGSNDLQGRCRRIRGDSGRSPCAGATDRGRAARLRPLRDLRRLARSA